MNDRCNVEKQSFFDTCIEALKASGARVTKSRLAIVKELSNANKALTARELYGQISSNKELENIDQVTVYRVLEALRNLRLVHQVFPSGGYLPCYHLHCGNHLHNLIHCTLCEGISELDVPQETLAPMLWYLKDEHGFSPNEHLFQINGTCSQCH